ncbi:MAG: ATP-binding protein [Magnetococcus sp. DMHC-6]
MIKIVRSNPPPPISKPFIEPWRILIVDDEPDIHKVTRLSLDTFIFENRPIAFISCYSGQEAVQILEKENDFALALIDVVMETDNAGLVLVEYIRNRQRNKFMRLIIRTGQPGTAPEKEILEKYDIDDYKDKTELTSLKLYTMVRSGLKAFRDIHLIQEQSNKLFHADRLSTLGTMAAAMAHEIKNPNSFILGNLPFLRDYIALARPILEKYASEDSTNRLRRFLDQVPKSLDEIAEGSRRINDLVDLLKNYGRAETKTEKKHFFLSDAWDDALTLLRFRLRQQQVYIETNLPKEAFLLGNRQQFSQIFINLINNSLDAIESTNHLKKNGKISCQAHIENHTIHLSFLDNGPGIPMDVANKIFQPFFTTKEPGKGTGLGLAIILDILKELNGQILLRTPTDGGTEFLITLSLANLDKENET